ncbi:sugar ABC transporter permease [Microbacterium sp. LWH11-1.2]|uniref:carbohydrate ABC transporter permease n=1 Tax=Microbacterium sp. LWH11-1.2 TaxID=3135258 RepID=UPI00313A35D1
MSRATTLAGIPLRRSEISWAYIALIPFLILFLAFTVWPLVRTVQFSFFDYNGIGALDESPMVGFDNFAFVFSDQVFGTSYLNTWIFTVGQALIKLPLSFLIAVLLVQRWLKWRGFFRVVFFLPWLMPPSIVAMVFFYLLNPNNGAINELLLATGLVSAPIDFLASPPIAFSTIAVISTWQIMGQYVIFWMAALQLVPQSLYEAAEVDGAGGWRRIWHITLPIIRPMAVIIASLGLIWSFNIFDWVDILTSGGPGNSTFVVNYYVYDKAFGNATPQFGIASAAATLFGISVLIIYALVGRAVAKAQARRKEYGV